MAASAGEAGLLASVYRRSLEVAADLGCKSVAFSAISTGVFGYPRRPAAEIAVKTVSDWLAKGGAIDQVIFCCYDAETADIYRALLGSA